MPEPLPAFPGPAGERLQREGSGHRDPTPGGTPPPYREACAGCLPSSSAMGSREMSLKFQLSLLLENSSPPSIPALVSEGVLAVLTVPYFSGSHTGAGIRLPWRICYRWPPSKCPIQEVGVRLRICISSKVACGGDASGSVVLYESNPRKVRAGRPWALHPPPHGTRFMVHRLNSARSESRA